VYSRFQEGTTFRLSCTSSVIVGIVCPSVAIRCIAYCDIYLGKIAECLLFLNALDYGKKSLQVACPDRTELASLIHTKQRHRFLAVPRSRRSVLWFP
jgi:hypothetical protein